MRILILDDDDSRHKVFAQNLATHTVTHAYSYDQALEALLTSESFDVIYLDHDLDMMFEKYSVAPPESPYGGERAYDGRDVARFIAKALSQEKHPEWVVVHSWNESAAREMVDILKKARIRTYRLVFSPSIGLDSRLLGTVRQ